MPTVIKTEPGLDENICYGMPHVTGTSRDETGHEVIEIISDSEDSADDERPILKTENLSNDSDMRTSMILVEEELKKDLDTTEIPKFPTGNLKKGGPGNLKQSPLPFDPSI